VREFHLRRITLNGSTGFGLSLFGSFRSWLLVLLWWEQVVVQRSNGTSESVHPLEIVRSLATIVEALLSAAYEGSIGLRAGDCYRVELFLGEVVALVDRILRGVRRRP
jgi:hypothetical protein